MASQASTGSGDDAARRAVRLNVHGHGVDLRCALPGLRQVIDDVLRTLVVHDWPEGSMPIEGMIETYETDVVARHLSVTADRVCRFGDYAELWRDGERCWLIDEAWGICEINLLKRTWRSWVLPQSQIDPIRTFEQAVLWPMSQVLISRGLAVVPMASVVHRGRGALVLSPFSLEPELSTWVLAGHGLIAQRWTALREEAGRVLMLNMPGRIERSPIPQLRSRVRTTDVLSTILPATDWVDLSIESQSNCHYAWCDLVLVVEPGRRGVASSKPLTGASATAAVRRAWPIPDAGAMQRHAQLAARIGQQIPVFQVELSRDPRALLRLLEQIPINPAHRTKLQADVHVAAPRSLAG